MKDVNYNANFIDHLFMDDQSTPDTYYPGEGRTPPPGKFVISRNLKGKPISTYADDTWDFRSYRNPGNTDRGKLIFNFKSKDITSEVKWLTFLLIYVSEPERGSFLSISTIMNYYGSLKKLGYYAQRQDILPKEVLSNLTNLENFISSLNTRKDLTSTSSILHHLSTIPIEISGYRIFYGIKQKIHSKKLEIKDDEQHPVIPPRILSNLINSLDTFLHDIYSCEEVFFNFLEKLAENPQFARSKSMQTKLGLTSKQFEPCFLEAAAIYQLEEVFLKYNIANTPNFSGFLTRLQHACRIYIHLYSGMRQSEALSLSTESLSITKTRTQYTYKLKGITSKLSGQGKSTSWVSSCEIEGPFRIARKLSLLVAKFAEIESNAPPLFISLKYLGFSSPQEKNPDLIALSHTSNKCSEVFHYFDDTQFSITNSDLDHLEGTNPFRAWEAENAFSVGSVWRFTTHQFRRSLAFYCSQSANVSLPSLKRQLKHLSREMSVYYCQSSSIHSEFSSDQHISQLFISEKPASDAYAYLKLVLQNNEKLFGSHGKFVEKNVKFNKNTILESSRKTLISKFKKGELAYKETAIGACTTTSPCDKRLFRSISACLSCNRAIVTKSKIERVIRRQNIFVQELGNDNTTSIEFRTEKRELDALINFRDNVIYKKD
ncbi:MAG: integrase [Candidatus Azotimanducaceae bacterium]|jgi:integrase